jgi:hypothetical protein
METKIIGYSSIVEENGKYYYRLMEESRSNAITDTPSGNTDIQVTETLIELPEEYHPIIIECKQKKRKLRIYYDLVFGPIVADHVEMI